MLYKNWLIGWPNLLLFYTTYKALMECNLVALDKRPGVHPVRIEETLLRVLTKIVKREAGDQTKIACGNLHMCTGLEEDIEGITHAVGQRQRKITVRIRRLEESGNEVKEEKADEATGEGMTMEIRRTE